MSLWSCFILILIFSLFAGGLGTSGETTCSNWVKMGRTRGWGCPPPGVQGTSRLQPAPWSHEAEGPPGMMAPFAKYILNYFYYVNDWCAYIQLSLKLFKISWIIQWGIYENLTEWCCQGTCYEVGHFHIMSCAGVGSNSLPGFAAAPKIFVWQGYKIVSYLGVKAVSLIA